MNYSIHEVAEILGISQSTIRRYEERGLIQVERSDGNGYRRYSLWDLVQVSIILSMQRQTYDTNQILESISNTVDMKKKAATTHRKLEMIDQQIRELELARECYRDQERLEKLMESLTASDFGYYCRPEMYIYPIAGNVEEDKKNPYFESVRNVTELFHGCRFCHLLRQNEWIPAFSVPRRILEYQGEMIHLTATQTLVMPDYSGKREQIESLIEKAL